METGPLTFIVPTNTGEDIVVLLSPPVENLEKEFWECKYKVRQGTAEFGTTIYGVDGLQALYLALRVVDAELRRLGTDGFIFDGEPP